LLQKGSKINKPEGKLKKRGGSQVRAQIAEWGLKVDLPRLEEAYLNSKVLTQRQYAAVIRLLEIFGRELSAAANRMSLRDTETEPPMIRRAKAYIAGHYGDPVGLAEMARTMQCEHLLLLQNV